MMCARVEQEGKYELTQKDEGEAGTLNQGALSCPYAYLPKTEF